MPTHLPPELVCKIFLHAAQSSSSSCRTLCEVSTWARHLALPHLYATISLNTCDTLAQFLLSVTTPSLLLPAPTAFRPAEAVRNVWVTTISAKFKTLVQRCPNISRIAFDGYNFTWLVDGDASLRRGPRDADRGPDLDVLMLYNGTQHDWTTFCYARYRNINTAARITHLRLGDPVKFETQLRMGHMRRLTHLAVPCGNADVEDLAHILPVVRHTSVEFFVLIVSEEYMTKDQCREVEDWVRLTRKTEGRIYMVRPLYDQLRDEWNAEVRGGATVWERASQYTRSLSPV